jgi:hypothetical protein
MYDRFANTFRYVPLNGDIAGTCARNDINHFPWFSPAGTARGAILNAVKLAYNPSKTQRDKLYSARVNPVIFSPGAGIILFGDKTGFANHQHLIELTFVACSYTSRMQSLLLLKINSLSSTMRLQEQTL